MAEFVLENLRRRFGDALERVSDDLGDLTVWVDRGRVHELLEHCKRDPQLDFNFCMDVTAIDYLALGGDPRFAVVYHLDSLETGKRIRVKTGVPEDDPVVDTASGEDGAALPRWLSFDAATRTFSGIPTNDEVARR